MSTESKKKVLIVDDEPELLRATARALRACGWEVSVSPGPIDPKGYDVALLDWQPYGPRMLLGCLAFDVPFVIYTAAELPLQNCPPCPVVAKPYAIADLDAALRGACR